jgi:hypothetical protein
MNKTAKSTPRTLSTSLEHHITTWWLFGDANPAHSVTLREALGAEVAPRTRRTKPVKPSTRPAFPMLLPSVHILAAEAAHGCGDRPAA